MFVAHLISTDLNHGHLLLADCILNNPTAIDKIKQQLRDQSKQVMLYLFLVFQLSLRFDISKRISKSVIFLRQKLYDISRTFLYLIEKPLLNRYCCDVMCILQGS